MPVTVSQFRTDFPEFTNAPGDAVVTRCLTQAALLTGGFPVEVRDTATALYAAHLITRDPRGEPTAMAPYGNVSSAMTASVQRGDRTQRGAVDQYLAQFQDLKAAYIIPILVSD